VKPLHTPNREAKDYASMGHWELYSSALRIEHRQLHDEGRDVAQYKPLVEEIAKLPPSSARGTLADAAADLLFSAPMHPDYPYEEPSDLPGIQAARQPFDGPALCPPARPDAEKIRGAWRGRIAGCLLGKPVEGIRTAELHPLLKESNNFPMRRYIHSTDVPERMKGRCWADTVPCAPADDDTNYTAMSACVLLPRYGRDFTPDHVIGTWLRAQRKDAYCTAERVAFLNRVNGFTPPASATHKNPYREWIGAQIRADDYGYINPGNPSVAADMAWRDACVSHTKNGIYGAMFVAAMLAAAAVCDDVREVIQRGLAEIPLKSRLYEAVHEILAMCEAAKSMDDCAASIHSRWDENDAHDWCHTIPNAMIVTAALLCGGDFSQSICMAVQCGFDTDCNGATVGSIAGMMAGAQGIPAVWTKPLGGKLETDIFGVGTIEIAELVRLTLEACE